MTIDTSVSAEGGSARFFQRAILHGLRDLQASFCEPMDLALSITVREDYARSELITLSEAVREIELVLPCRVGKLHSGIGRDETTLTVAAVGLQKQSPSLRDLSGGKIWMTGPVCDPGLPWSSFEDVHQAFKEAERYAASEALLGKDVSGDGLAGAAWQLAQDHQLDLELRIDSIPTDQTSFPSDDCDIDRNLTDYLADVQGGDELDSRGRFLMFKPQFCGPILFLADSEEDYAAVEVGSFTTGSGKVRLA